MLVYWVTWVAPLGIPHGGYQLIEISKDGIPHGGYQVGQNIIGIQSLKANKKSPFMLYLG